MNKKNNAHGYYEVAGKKYNNKLAAFDAAFSIGHCPHWNFFEDEFSKADWAIEPSEQIFELYRQRAQSIRNQVDHVILWFSGGADSWTIADAFVSNNIQIDEIWTAAPYGWNDPQDHSKHATNQANEVRLTAIPEAKKFISKDPRIKYKVVDTSDTIVNFWKNNTVDPFMFNHYVAELPVREFFKDLTPDNNSKSASIVKIFGIDKPRVIYNSGKFYMTFLDQIVNSRISTNGTINNDGNCYDEAFYWHPGAVKILIKQGHLIKNWFKENPQLLPLLTYGSDGSAIYQKVIQPLIYPTYNSSLWQAVKNKGLYEIEIYHTFSDNQDSIASQNWRKTVKTYSDAVYDMYQQHNRLGDSVVQLKNYDWYYALPGCYSKLYCLGE